MTQFKKCKVVMLPTEGESRIYRKNDKLPNNPVFTENDLSKIPKEGTLWFYTYPYTEYNPYWDPQHLYILSDEEIKEGDWYLHIGNIAVVVKCSDIAFVNIPNVTKGKCWKVIASTDKSLGIARPSESFIKKYCELGGIDEVIVEYYGDGYKLKETEWGGWKKDRNDYQLFIKIAPDNTITIKKVKDNWTKEDVQRLKEKLKDMHNGPWDGWLHSEIKGYKKALIRVEKWIDENINRGI